MQACSYDDMRTPYVSIYPFAILYGGGILIYLRHTPYITYAEPECQLINLVNI